MTLVGGREIHPINVRVGGFYRAPTRRSCGRSSSRSSAPARPRSRPSAGRRASTFPSVAVECEFVALSPAGRIPDRGRPHPLGRGARHRAGRVRRALRGGAGRAFDRPALAPPGARRVPVRPARALQLNLDRSRRSRRRRPATRAWGRLPRSLPEHRRPQRRGRLRVRRGAPPDRRYEEPDAPAVAVEPVAGTGFGVSEAPRGLLYHRYRVDAEGTILDAKIVPPTSQNQQAIEDDLATSSAVTRTWASTSCAASASRRFATTTRASRAPPTSSPSTMRACVMHVDHRHRQRIPARRRRRARGRRAATRPVAAGVDILECEQEPSRLDRRVGGSRDRARGGRRPIRRRARDAAPLRRRRGGRSRREGLPFFDARLRRQRGGRAGACARQAPRPDPRLRGGRRSSSPATGQGAPVDAGVEAAATAMLDDLEQL